MDNMQCDGCKRWFSENEIDPAGDDNDHRLCGDCEYINDLDKEAQLALAEQNINYWKDTCGGIK